MYAIFQKVVYGIVKRIPKGKVSTYALIAKLAGRSKAARLVGNILNKNYDKNVPCHRVVRSDGKVGRYNGLAGDKISLLKKEGVMIINGLVDLKKYQWEKK